MDNHLPAHLIEAQIGPIILKVNILNLFTLYTTILRTVKTTVIIFIWSIELFKVSEEAKEFLKTIKEKIGVISVAGKYRTGKSFLLNRVIINKKNQGFGVGPTINPCTKGLWIWGGLLETEY